MKRVAAVASGVWELVAGDDWVSAVGVVLALGLTALLSENAAAWLVLPIAVVSLLTFSIWREARNTAPVASESDDDRRGYPAAPSDEARS